MSIFKTWIHQISNHHIFRSIFIIPSKWRWEKVLKLLMSDGFYGNQFCDMHTLTVFQALRRVFIWDIHWWKSFESMWNETRGNCIHMDVMQHTARFVWIFCNECVSVWLWRNEILCYRCHSSTDYYQIHSKWDLFLLSEVYWNKRQYIFSKRQIQCRSKFKIY